MGSYQTLDVDHFAEASPWNSSVSTIFGDYHFSTSNDDEDQTCDLDVVDRLLKESIEQLQKSGFLSLSLGLCQHVSLVTKKPSFNQTLNDGEIVLIVFGIILALLLPIAILLFIITSNR